MSDKCRGTLLFYRWPPDTDWNEAPAECSQFLQGDVPVVHLGIWHGNQRGKEVDPWSPEVRTAIALVQVEDLPHRDADTLERIFESGPKQCRFRNGVAASSVFWLSGRQHSDIPTATRSPTPRRLGSMCASVGRMLPNKDSQTSVQ